VADRWSNLRVRQMTVDEAKRVAAWRYSGAWSIYDLSSAQSLIDYLSRYHTIVAGETLIGFCCTGEAARVPGLSEEPAILDVGMGMAPGLVGRGHGTAFGQTVVSYLAEHYPDKALRAVIQSWNGRSLRVAQRLGFQDAGELTTVKGGQSVAYRIVIRYHRRTRRATSAACGPTPRSRS
jgi:[ribosomal protein S18]-alanine N-acetyltransferase